MCWVSLVCALVTQVYWEGQRDGFWGNLGTHYHPGLGGEKQGSVILTTVFVIKIPNSYPDALADGKTGAHNRAIIRCLLREARCGRGKARKPNVNLGIRYLEAEGDIGVELARESGRAGCRAYDEVALQADPVYLRSRGLNGLDQVDSGRGFCSGGFNVVVIVCSTVISIGLQGSRASRLS